MGLAILLSMLLIGLAYLAWVEKNEDRIQTDREIGALVKENRARAKRSAGRNPVRYAACGYTPPRKKGGGKAWQRRN